MGFKVLFDQVLGDLIGCSFQLNEVIMLLAYSFEHNEPKELIVIHQFNLDNHFMFLH